MIYSCNPVTFKSIEKLKVNVFSEDENFGSKVLLGSFGKCSLWPRMPHLSICYLYVLDNKGSPLLCLLQCLTLVSQK